MGKDEKMSVANLKIILGGITFVVPDEISYLQYREAINLLDSLKVDLQNLLKVKSSGSGKVKMTFTFTDILKSLIKDDKLPELFAIILVPEGQEWDNSFIEKHKSMMSKIGDKTFVEVAKSFLSGRTDLIHDLVDFFASLKLENNLSLTNLNEETKKDGTEM